MTAHADQFYKIFDFTDLPTVCSCTSSLGLTLTMELLSNIHENPLLQNLHARRRADIGKLFPELEKCPHDNFLFIYKYIQDSPQRFFTHSVYSIFLNWLKERNRTGKVALQQYLHENDAELNRAFQHLEEINKLEWHDFFKQPDDFELIRFIDQQIHPTYLRLIEAVFTPLARMVVHFSRMDSGKGTDGLGLYAVVQELAETSFREAVSPCKHIVRNAIAHGGITYLQNEIIYRDKKGNEERCRDRDVIRIFDDLLDNCNALALAFSLFVLVCQSDGYKLPQSLLLDELKEEIRSPWWEVVGCTPSVITGFSQLIIYARSSTMDAAKVRISTLQTGVLAERFAPGYERYFVSIRSSLLSWPGYAAFHGEKLHSLRISPNVRLEDYSGVLQDSPIFYVSKVKIPRFITRIQNMALSITINLPITLSENRRTNGWPEIYVREANIHRNSWGCVLNGSVHLVCQSDDTIQDIVRKFRKRIIQKALSAARHKTSIFSISRFLPLGFARISVFSKDYRRRRLSNFGLAKDLICTIQVKRINRHKMPRYIRFYN